MNPPAFRFYVDNFIEGTVDMTDAEVGLYIRLLCAQWSRGGLPDNNDELARFSRGSTAVEPMLNRIRQKFNIDPDGSLRNERMEHERRKQMRFQSSQAAKGKASASARKNRGSTAVKSNPGSTAVQPSTPPTAVEPSVSVSVSSHTELSVELPEGFPKTRQEAKAHTGFIGCSEDFAAETWDKAAGRGGRDAKDVPIRSFRHHLQHEFNMQKNRATEKQNGHNHKPNQQSFSRNQGTHNEGNIDQYATAGSRSAGKPL